MTLIIISFESMNSNNLFHIPYISDDPVPDLVVHLVLPLGLFKWFYCFLLILWIIWVSFRV